MSICAGTNGYLDDIPVPDVRRFETELLDYVGRGHETIFDTIAGTGALEDDVVTELDLGDRVVQGSSSCQRWPPAVDFRSPSRARTRRARRRSGLQEGARPGSTRRAWPTSTEATRPMSHGWPGADPAPTHQVGPVDEEDHARDGAHRRDRGSSRRSSGQPRRRRTPSEITEVVSAVAGQRRRPSTHPLVTDASEPALVPPSSSYRRPRSVRRLQLQRPARGRGARREAPDGAREPRSYLVGRKAEGYFRLPRRPIDATFTGFTEQPTYDGRQGGRGRSDRRLRARRRGSRRRRRGPPRLHPFISAAGSQRSRSRLGSCRCGRRDDRRADADGPRRRCTSSSRTAESILDALLPRYVEARIYAALLNAAASEHAARQRAMKAATDNADELIKTLTRMEPRPPGLDHPRDHGDRRRRRGAAAPTASSGS